MLFANLISTIKNLFTKKPVEVGPVDPARVVIVDPPHVVNAITNYNRFYFLCSNDLSKDHLARAKATYGKVLVGFDPGDKDKPEDNSVDVINAAQELGLGLHVYFVGPTMQSWSAEERAQTKFLAESIGIDTSNDGWLKEWYSEGWKKKVSQQFEFYWKNYKAYSLEIDNLDSTTMKDDMDQYIDYFIDLDKELLHKGIGTRLMLKNIDEDGLEKIEKAVNDGRIDKDFFAQWAMFEEGSGDEHKQYEICRRMGIRAVTPSSGLRETHSYGVSPDGIPSLAASNDPWTGRDSTYNA